MFGRNRRERRTKFNPAMESILEEMQTYGPDSEEYPGLLTSLERIVKLQNGEEKKPIDPSQMILVAGNLLGILIIVAYEQKHVMTSKGLGFVLKTK